MKSVTVGGTTVVFDPEKHAYHAEGIFVPGVTSILGRIAKPALIPWAANTAIAYIRDNISDIDHPSFWDDAKKSWRSYSEDAMAIGTEVHEYAEKNLRGDLAVLPRGIEAQKSVAAFLEWRQAHHITLIEAEKLVFHKGLWYAGTCDFYGKIDGQICVLDFKTSARVYDEYLIQLAAYAMAIEEEIGVDVNAGWIVRLDKKTGKFQAVKCDLTQGTPSGDNARGLWYHIKEFDKLSKERKNGL